MRKGVMFTLTAFGVVAVLVTFLLLSFGAPKHALADGTDQLAALQAFYDGEQALFYLDNAAKKSFMPAFFAMAQGEHERLDEVIATPGCGTYRGIELWEVDGKTCYPDGETPKIQFREAAAGYMNYYGAQYEGLFVFTRPTDLLVKEEGDTVIMQSGPMRPLKLDFFRDGTRLTLGETPEQPKESHGTWDSWPMEGPVTTCYGWVRDPDLRWHDGIDLGAGYANPPVKALDNGVVSKICIEAVEYCGGYGNVVIIDHNEGEYYTFYAHLEDMYVGLGQRIAKGDVVGIAGHTGFSIGGGNHLHFGVTYDGTLFNNHGGSDKDKSRNPLCRAPKSLWEGICDAPSQCDGVK